MHHFKDIKIHVLFYPKVKRTGMPPGPRAGFSMCVHKKRALLFGGVVDMEMQGTILLYVLLFHFFGLL